MQESRTRKICHCAKPSDCPQPDAADVCHLATCSSAGACGIGVNVNVQCDDGNVCTTNDVCQENGVCAGTPVTNTTACSASDGGAGICCDSACVGYIVSENETACCVSDGCAGGACIDCNDNGAGTCQPEGSFCCPSGFVCPANTTCLTVGDVTTCCANGACSSESRGDYCLDDNYQCCNNNTGSCPVDQECCSATECCISPWTCSGGGVAGECGCTATGDPVIDSNNPSCCTGMSTNCFCTCAADSAACVADYNCCSGSCDLTNGDPGVCVALI